VGTVTAMGMPGPFDDLEPPTPPRSAERRAGAMTILFRGATRRCPRCGARGLFAGPFTIRRTCPTCSLRLEREEGGFLGAMAINYSVTTLLWVILLAVWLVADLPDIHVAALTVVSLVFVAVFPLGFWSFSKTIWAAVDLLVYRTDPRYPSESAADRASGNGGRA
jgi:uncharacterized protein (DUF983 family)